MSVSIFAIFFGAQSLLWGMGLASLPLIIHLLNRRRFKIVDWAAMQWLLEAIRKNRRRVRLEQWLLLALRTLLIALVVAAMAKPLLESSSFVQAAVTTSATHHIIVFDNTMSMQFAAVNQTRWEKAKGMAHTILDDARKGDLASFVTIGTPSVAVVNDPSPDLAAVGREIDALKPQHATGNVDEAMAHVERLLKQSRAASKIVYVLSDLQKNTWAGREKEGTATAGETRQEAANRLKRISAQSGVWIVDLAEADAGNASVASVETSEPLVVRNRPTVIRTRIVNHSKQPRRDLRVELIVENQIEKAEAVQLGPGEESTVNFGHHFVDAGEKIVEVRIAADGLKPDDVRRMTVNVRDSLRVLLIDGQPSGEPFKSETDYLRVALSPQTEDQSVGLIRTDVKLESDLLETKLDDYDVVAVCNVAQLTTTEATVLEDYLKRGGSVAFFLGSQTNIEAYNRQLYAEGAGLLPVRLTGTVGDATKRDVAVTFDPLGYRHPLVQAFRGAEQAGLITARIFRYVKMEIPDAAKATVAMAFSTKDPAVVVGAKHRGVVAAIATGCDLDWNSWAISASFVPFVQELVLHLSEHRGRRPALIAGDAIVLPVTAKGADATAKVTTPDTTAGILPIAQERGADSLVFPRTDLTGVYKIEMESPVRESIKVCVNAPSDESDLTKLTADDLRTLFPGFNFRLIDQWRGRGTASSVADGGRGELHRQLLYLALFCALAETVVAWRFGHHR